MPSIEENQVKWNTDYKWSKAGDEWSDEWGGINIQWNGMIYPRIKNFLPASTILEIAPGHGRWTQFLKSYCNELILADISENCIQRCQQRFAEATHIRYFVNDGKSLDFVENNKVDFIFCFDSLVHAEQDVIEGYIAEFEKKLSKDGVVFLHHSNLGAYPIQLLLSRIQILRILLRKLKILEQSFHWRGTTMSANKIIEYTNKYNLKCISQEFLPWRTNRIFIDCISVITKPESIWSCNLKQYKNYFFMQDAKNLKTIYDLYQNKE